MTFANSRWAVWGSTSLLVLFWSSGAIVARLGLDYASPFALLFFRFAIALAVVSALRRYTGPWLPPRGARKRVAMSGALLVGAYPVCYLLALQAGLTPGVLATVLGVQPVLTLLVQERGHRGARLAGLALAFAGLVLVVGEGFSHADVPAAGMGWALAALAAMTAGAIVQKGVGESPIAVLPLQNAIGLAVCAACVPFQPFAVDVSPGFFASVLWLALVISVFAQLLLYRLIRAGNLVDVTSLFYLVPGVTALLDYLLLGNALSPRTLAGLAAVVAGLVLVFGRTGGAKEGVASPRQPALESNANDSHKH